MESDGAGYVLNAGDRGIQQILFALLTNETLEHVGEAGLSHRSKENKPVGRLIWEWRNEAPDTVEATAWWNCLELGRPAEVGGERMLDGEWIRKMIFWVDERGSG